MEINGDNLDFILISFLYTTKKKEYRPSSVYLNNSAIVSVKVLFDWKKVTRKLENPKWDHHKMKHNRNQKVFIALIKY